MKKARNILCLVLVLLSFSACGNINRDSSQTTTAIETSNEVFSTTAQTVTAETTSDISKTTAVTTTVATTSSHTTEVTTEKAVPTTAKKTVATTTKVSTTAPTTKKPVVTTKGTTQSTTKKSDTCIVTIICTTINDNLHMLKSAKKDFVPTDGIILNEVNVEVKAGDTAFDIIKKACKDNTCKANCKYCQKSGIQIEYTYTPAFDNYYIEGIHQIYEKDCGIASGWMYSVNGIFPNVGASSYDIKPGDKLVFAYTCDMGEDIGNTY